MMNDPVNDIEGYIKKCYKFLNGKINPYYPSRKLEIENRDIDFEEDSHPKKTINGYAILDHIKIYPDRIMHFLDNYNGEISLPEIRGYVIAVVAHELSHLDQYIPWFALVIENGKPLAENLTFHYEMMNDMNTMLFITKFKQEIAYELGDYDPYFYQSVSNYISDMDGYTISPLEEYKHIPYRKYTSRVEKLWNAINGFCLMDAQELCRDKNIYHLAFIIKNSYNGTDVFFTIPLQNLERPESHLALQIEEDFNACMNQNLNIGCFWTCRIFIQKDQLIIRFECLGAEAELYEDGIDSFRAYYERTGFDAKHYTGKAALKRSGLLKR